MGEYTGTTSPNADDSASNSLMKIARSLYLQSPSSGVTGGATEAKQDTGNASLTVISTKFSALSTTAPQFTAGTAGNAVTRTLAAAGSGVSNVIEGWGVSMSGSPASAVTFTITDNGTEIFKEYITTGGPTGPMIFPRPIKGTANTALVGTLSAPGGSIVGIVTFYGARTE